MVLNDQLIEVFTQETASVIASAVSSGPHPIAIAHPGCTELPGTMSDDQKKRSPRRTSAEAKAARARAIELRKAKQAAIAEGSRVDALPSYADARAQEAKHYRDASDMYDRQAKQARRDRKVTRRTHAESITGQEMTVEVFAKSHAAEIELAHTDEHTGEKTYTQELARRRTTYMDKLISSGNLASDRDLEAMRFTAANRFAMDYEIGVEPRVKTTKFDEGLGGGGDPDDAAVMRHAAARRYQDALKAIPLNARASSVTAIINGVAPYDKDDNRAQRAIKTDQVRTGCDALVDHYGITAEDVRPSA